MVLSCLIALGALATHYTTNLEAFGFVTGVICVWLASKEHIWNWPVGLLNSSVYAVFLFGQRLYADAGLMVVYFVLGIVGWYWWLKGGKERTELHIQQTPAREWPILLLIAALGFVPLYFKLVGEMGTAPAFDAFTTITSLAAQYLLTRKFIENWILWISVDIVYTPLYAWKGLYLSAILYGIFTIIAFLGLREWNRLRNEKLAERKPMPAAPFVYGLLGLGIVLTGWMTVLCVRYETGLPAKARLALKQASDYYHPNPIRVTYETLDASGQVIGVAQTLDDAAELHFVTNARDPMLYRPEPGAKSDSRPLVRLRIVEELQKGGQVVELLQYEIFSDHARVEGHTFSLAAWEKVKRYMPNP